MRIILGVTGCIAAYKAAEVLRALQRRGHEIFPVMTTGARHFLPPLTLEKLSGNPVTSELFGQDASTDIEHIALARNSDLLLVAPATANCLAKCAVGIADDFLSTLFVSTSTPVVLAPAMNVEMWRHPATQHNLQVLRRRGVAIVEPEAGYLACGETGEGRLAPTEDIVAAAQDALSSETALKGTRVLITAGPTIEDIDPVRYLTSRSSGKMGYALAQEAQSRGARVTLVSGPTHLEPPAGVEVAPVRSAADMRRAVLAQAGQQDVIVMAAAVSDFTPSRPARHKLKKGSDSLELTLETTTDILLELGKCKKENQFLVGFAAETGSLVDNARFKLKSKNLDLIVANDVSGPDIGFASDSNQVSILDPQGGLRTSDRLPKVAIAALIWDEIEKRLPQRASTRQAAWPPPSAVKRG